jgi:hypothetical protein
MGAGSDLGRFYFLDEACAAVAGVAWGQKKREPRPEAIVTAELPGPSDTRTLGRPNNAARKYRFLLLIEKKHRHVGSGGWICRSQPLIR